MLPDLAGLTHDHDAVFILVSIEFCPAADTPGNATIVVIVVVWVILKGDLVCRGLIKDLGRDDDLDLVLWFTFCAAVGGRVGGVVHGENVVGRVVGFLFDAKGVRSWGLQRQRAGEAIGREMEGCSRRRRVGTTGGSAWLFRKEGRDHA